MKTKLLLFLTCLQAELLFSQDTGYHRYTDMPDFLMPFDDMLKAFFWGVLLLGFTYILLKIFKDSLFPLIFGIIGFFCVLPTICFLVTVMGAVGVIGTIMVGLFIIIKQSFDKK